MTSSQSPTIEELYEQTVGVELGKAKTKATIDAAEAFWSAAMVEARTTASIALLSSGGDGIGGGSGSGGFEDDNSGAGEPKMHILSYSPNSQPLDKTSSKPIVAAPLKRNAPSSSTAAAPAHFLGGRSAREVASVVSSVVGLGDEGLRAATNAKAEEAGAVVYEHQRWGYLSGWRPTAAQSPSAVEPPPWCTEVFDPERRRRVSVAHRPLSGEPLAALESPRNVIGHSDTGDTGSSGDSGEDGCWWEVQVDSRFTDLNGWVYGTDWARMLLNPEEQCLEIDSKRTGVSEGNEGDSDTMSREGNITRGESESSPSSVGPCVASSSYSLSTRVARRDGGRAAERTTDRVRRRVWIICSSRNHQESGASPRELSGCGAMRGRWSREKMEPGSESAEAVPASTEVGVGRWRSSTSADEGHSPSGVARAVFFDVLRRLARRKRLNGFWGTAGLLDGTAWWRTVRRDVADYEKWLDAPCCRLVAAAKLGKAQLARETRTARRAEEARQRLEQQKGLATLLGGGYRDAGGCERGVGADGGVSMVTDVRIAVQYDSEDGEEDEFEYDSEEEDEESEDDAGGAIIGSARLLSSRGRGGRRGKGRSVVTRGSMPSDLGMGTLEDKQSQLQVLALAGECLSVPPGRLRFAAAGALHACAAYGYPMAKGWLSSVREGATLLTWRRMTGVFNRVDAVRGVGGDSHSAAARAIVGPQFEILAANWTSRTFTPVWYASRESINDSPSFGNSSFSASFSGCSH